MPADAAKGQVTYSPWQPRSTGTTGYSRGLSYHLSCWPPATKPVESLPSSQPGWGVTSSPIGSSETRSTLLAGLRPQNRWGESLREPAALGVISSPLGSTESRATRQKGYSRGLSYHLSRWPPATKSVESLSSQVNPTGSRPPRQPAGWSSRRADQCSSKRPAHCRSAARIPRRDCS